MLLKRRAVLGVTALSVTTWASTALAAPKPPRIALDHVMVFPELPGFIVPCFKVRRRLYERSLNRPRIGVELTVSYYSRQVLVEQTFVVALGDMELSTHHEQPAGNKLRLVEIAIEVSDDPPDSGTLFSGSARIVRLPKPAGSNDNDDDDDDDDDDDGDC